MKPLRVRISLWGRTLGAALILLLLIGSFDAWVGYGNLFYALICLCGANVLLLPFLMFGPIEMNDEYIVAILPVGRFEMAWDEVQSIEKAPHDSGAIVFHGQNKKLVIANLDAWVGFEAAAMMALFNTQVHNRAIPIKDTFLADWQLSRGARVREF